MYTYFNSDKCTTVDYIFTDIVIAEYIDSCYTHDHHGLNSSDHHPVSCELQSHINGSMPEVMKEQSRRSNGIVQCLLGNAQYIKSASPKQSQKSLGPHIAMLKK